ncbi:MAG: [FeFe] hydrogenase H-cluster maturation GTPase HydF [Faecalimonas sp.]|nr:[FeFe] hydrogenase H-cluster maturation GTPase HydF [Faecalimonas sp.]
MNTNSTPMAERLHIGIFGRRNAGKSSLINAITGQNLAIVSDVKGTTTDPVSKSMELLPIGPVVLIDTPGIDDEGELGELRTKRAYDILNKTDIALLVVADDEGLTVVDAQLLKQIRSKRIPYLIVYNKADEEEGRELRQWEISVSALSGYHIQELKERIAELANQKELQRHIVADLLDPLDVVVLVTPIDASAPKGRLILPQQQTIRDILDAGAIAIVVKDTELEETLHKLGTKPKLVITDSQVFEEVAKIVPPELSLTSFSILMARYKGDLDSVVKSVKVLDKLQEGDCILISEGCTHHRQCEDIGTKKLPEWISTYAKKQLQFEFTSGTEFPTDLSKYQLIVHCGGCMLNAREMESRQARAREQGIPMTNYGTVIAQMKGILERSLEVFQ